MKRLSPWLAVLLLGSVPLTAAAFDYGPNPSLMAANSDAPRLPGADVQAAAHGEMPGAEPAAADESDPVDAVAAPAPAKPAPARARRPVAPAATTKPHTPVPHALPTHTSSWQSLLPGSIQ